MLLPECNKFRLVGLVRETSRLLDGGRWEYIQTSSTHYLSRFQSLLREAQKLQVCARGFLVLWVLLQASTRSERHEVEGTPQKLAELRRQTHGVGDKTLVEGTRGTHNFGNHGVFQETGKGRKFVFKNSFIFWHFLWWFLVQRKCQKIKNFWSITKPTTLFYLFTNIRITAGKKLSKVSRHK